METNTIKYKTRSDKILNKHMNVNVCVYICISCVCNIKRLYGQCNLPLEIMKTQIMAA
jgi:hypothetical protein